MPKVRELLPLQRSLEEEEIEALRWGRVPREPGETCHVFMEGDCLYLRDLDAPHYTYWVIFERDEDAWRVAEAWASREFGEGRGRVSADVEFLDDYLDWLIEHNEGMSQTATRASWPCQPMPQACSLITYRRRLTGPEHACVARGLIPETMEDRWFIFLEDQWLYFHRSWSGHCIYMLRLTPEADGWRVAEAWVNGDPEQFQAVSEQESVRVIDGLIDAMVANARSDD